MIKICEHCGKEFETKYSFQKYCSEECYKKQSSLDRKEFCRKNKELVSQRNRLKYLRQKAKLPKRKCTVCGKFFTPSNKNQKNCRVHRGMALNSEIPFNGRDCHFCLDEPTCDHNHCAYF